METLHASAASDHVSERSPHEHTLHQRSEQGMITCLAASGRSAVHAPETQGGRDKWQRVFMWKESWPHCAGEVSADQTSWIAPSVMEPISRPREAESRAHAHTYCALSLVHFNGSVEFFLGSQPLPSLQQWARTTFMIRKILTNKMLEKKKILPY